MLSLTLTPASRARWANGVELVGAALEDPSSPEMICWMTAWRVLETPAPDVDYHWFNHLLDDEERKVGQMDGVPLAADNWRAGDTVVSWYDIPLAPETEPGDYTMWVGMYTYPDIHNVPLLDIAGHVVADHVDLGPIPIGDVGRGG